MTSPTAAPPPPLGARVSGLIRVSEIFGPTIQGEGPLIGSPTVFVRTGGCDYRCRWCDTPYAVLPEYRSQWSPMAPGAVIHDVLERSANQPILVTLSGGNPALQPLGAVLRIGHDYGCTFALETQGSVARPWFRELDYLVLSPKPPSSGEITTALDVQNALNAFGRPDRATLKIVIFDAADLDYALPLHTLFPDLPLTLQVGNPSFIGTPDPRDLLTRLDWLQEQVLARRVYDVRVLPQLHTLIWGNQRGR